jgi:Ca-activated chloride channel homolog
MPPASTPPALNYAPAAQVPSQVYVPPIPTNAETVLLILDASYSMSEKLAEGESKMAIAKRVLLDTLKAIPPNVWLGLRVYGLSSNPFTACSASQLVVPFGQNNRAFVANAIVGLRPTGETPISFSLQQAIQQDLAPRPGKKTIVLVTDGMETCDADPCRVAVQLVRAGSDVRINTVALGLAHDYDALRQLKCISAATYGRFYTADTSAELARGLAKSVQIETTVQAQILPKSR